MITLMDRVIFDVGPCLSWLWILLSSLQPYHPEYTQSCLNTPFQPLLACKVSFERSADSLMGLLNTFLKIKKWAKDLNWHFSKETLQARRDWQEVFQVMKGKGLHRRLPYPAKLTFIMEGQIKCFPDKVKLKEFIITKPLLYEMLKGLTKKKKIKNMNSKNDSKLTVINNHT